MRSDIFPFALPLPRPVQDANAGAAQASPFGDLPEWDLSDLYEGPDSAAYASDLDAVRSDAKAFAADYEGKLADLSGDSLSAAMTRYEAMSGKIGRIMSYAGLRYYQNTADAGRAKFMGDAQGRVTDDTAPMVFFTLELNRIADDRMAAQLAESEALRKYAPWIERQRALRPYQLSDELEKYLHDASVVGAAAWNRLFDETMARLSFDVDGETLPLEATLTLLSDANRAHREAAAEALVAVFQDNLPIFVRIMNTLVKEHEIEGRWRKMPSADAGRHLANQVEPEVVDALRTAVIAAYPKLSHRYYAMKAKWLGLDKMQHWDRNAPLPGEPDRKVSWQEAKDIVMSAYADFSPKMAEIAEPFFTKGWIDAPVKPGKAPGAFAHPTVTDVHPYVMLNYMGKTRDVMTLAHELGHGVHQVLAASQGELLSSTPLTLAETASVFGEMLTFKRLLRAETEPKKRKALLAGKVEDMLNTVVRQIAFYEFERRIHAARVEGELTADDICAIWMSVQVESLGEAFDFKEGYETFWCYVGHFIHSPFYVYAYAFGDGLVNALYAVYEENPDGFQDKYFDLLSAGGSKRHKELLAPFGLDASDPNFWDKGLSLISSMIDELEAME
ncbi:MAG: oligoendopeptidase F [Paracoccaceae bacterium]|jgi:oligoendopeptidase F